MELENSEGANQEELNSKNTEKEVAMAEEKPVVSELQKNDNMFENIPKKSGKGMILGLVLCAFLAVGGIGFGAWAMMDGNGQKEQLNTQINALKQQNSELMSKLSDDEESIIDDNINENGVNPIIQNQDPEILDHVSFVSVGNPRIRIALDKGDLFGCSFESDEDRDGGWDTKECSLGDIGGKIYKVVSFGGTQGYDPYIGFIMTDGTVKYFSFYDAMNSGDYSLKKLDLDGKVIDIVKITSGQKGASAGGYITNVFVLKDGSVVRFDESMVQ